MALWTDSAEVQLTTGFAATYFIKPEYLEQLVNTHYTQMHTYRIMHQVICHAQLVFFVSKKKFKSYQSIVASRSTSDQTTGIEHQDTT